MHRISKLTSLAYSTLGDLTPQLIIQQQSAGAFRTLYSASTLGLDAYVNTRERVKGFLADGDKFRGKMNEFVQESSRNMIFTEDLKNMIHLVEKNASDLELTTKMITKFNAQNKEVRFGNFIFGPVVMRMFHHLKEVDLAFQCFKNPEMDGFFDQLISYQILTDMLYENGRYKDVREVFNIIKSRQIQGGMYPKHVLVIVFAACYKENTPESFEYSKTLWKELNEVGHIPMRKTACFAAALAIAQNAPDIANEIITTIRQQNYMTVRNLKVLALARLGRSEDSLPVLRSVLDTPWDPQQPKHTFSEDVFKEVKNIILTTGDKDTISNFNKIEKSFIENGHVTNTKLDDLLCIEIVSTSQSVMRKDRSAVAASYSHNNQNNQYNQNNRYNNSYNNKQQSGGGRIVKRPGLAELY